MPSIQIPTGMTFDVRNAWQLIQMWVSQPRKLGTCCQELIRSTIDTGNSNDALLRSGAVSWWKNRVRCHGISTTEKDPYSKLIVGMKSLYPIGSMYGIYANIWGILMVNVTIYSIQGSYGYYNL